MARWTSMSKEEFMVRFRSGSAKGSVEWLPYLLRFVAMFLMVVAVQAVAQVVNHKATEHSLTSLLTLAMCQLIAFTFLLTLNLRQKEPHRAYTIQWSQFACVCAAVALIVYLLHTGK
jgi:hypothetical protein